jgi:hypothetical protein
MVGDPGKKQHLQQDNGVHAMRGSSFFSGRFFLV